MLVAVVLVMVVLFLMLVAGDKSAVDLSPLGQQVVYSTMYQVHQLASS